MNETLPAYMLETCRCELCNAEMQVRRSQIGEDVECPSCGTLTTARRKAVNYTPPPPPGVPWYRTTLFYFFAAAAFVSTLGGLAGGPSGIWKGLLVFGLLSIVAFFYFLPSFFAMWGEHHNSRAIFLLNLLLGWTLLGWIIALIWSTTKKPNTK